MWLTYPLDSHKEVHKQLSFSHNTHRMDQINCAIFVCVVLQENEQWYPVNKQNRIKISIHRILSSVSSSLVGITVLSGHRTSVLNCGGQLKSLTPFLMSSHSAEEKLVVAFPRIPSFCLVPGEIIQWEAPRWAKERPLFCGGRHRRRVHREMQVSNSCQVDFLRIVHMLE